MRTRTERRGFSLIEILIALAVVVPIVVVAAGVLPFFRLTSTRAWTEVCASDVAREQLERVRGTAFDAIPAAAGGSEDRNGTRFDWSLQAAQVGSATSLKRVVLTVSWNNPQPKQVAFETCIARTASSSAPAGTTSSVVSSPGASSPVDSSPGAASSSVDSSPGGASSSVDSSPGGDSSTSSATTAIGKGKPAK